MTPDAGRTPAAKTVGTSSGDVRDTIDHTDAHIQPAVILVTPKTTVASKNPAVISASKKNTAVTAKDNTATKSAGSAKTVVLDDCKSDDDDDIQIIDQEDVHFTPLKVNFHC